MKLLYIVDGRSPIALNWISYFVKGGHEVHLVSTFSCKPLPGLASLSFIPVAMSGVYRSAEGVRANPSLLRKSIRQLLAPWTFPRAAEALRQAIARIRPDLIHAMRIPFEGMVVAMAMKGSEMVGGGQKRAPLLISVWGNDFTLHARSTTAMTHFTQQALQAVDALHTDCQRDLRLAKEMGFASTKPAIVVPGGGGVNLDVFHPAEIEAQPITEKSPIRIINPRGIRAYVRIDTFFQAIPLVVSQFPEVRFLCPGMAGESQAQKWISDLAISEKVELLSAQPQKEMADLFRQSLISTSITTHDGTPNTLLEAMACGCFPIVGDIEALREWITPGENGLLVDPGDANALAQAIIRAISQTDMRLKAKERNLNLVKEKVEYRKTMHNVEEFYNRLISSHS
jgi:glycosyltransferase involved in cell wall biosynthesis